MKKGGRSGVGAGGGGSVVGEAGGLPTNFSQGGRPRLSGGGRVGRGGKMFTTPPLPAPDSHGGSIDRYVFKQIRSHGCFCV